MCLIATFGKCLSENKAPASAGRDAWPAKKGTKKKKKQIIAKHSKL